MSRLVRCPDLRCNDLPLRKSHIFADSYYSAKEADSELQTHCTPDILLLNVLKRRGAPTVSSGAKVAVIMGAICKATALPKYPAITGA